MAELQPAAETLHQLMRGRYAEAETGANQITTAIGFLFYVEQQGLACQLWLPCQ